MGIVYRCPIDYKFIFLGVGINAMGIVYRCPIDYKFILIGGRYNGMVRSIQRVGNTIQKLVNIITLYVSGVITGTIYKNSISFSSYQASH